MGLGRMRKAWIATSGRRRRTSTLHSPPVGLNSVLSLAHEPYPSTSQCRTIELPNALWDTIGSPTEHAEEFVLATFVGTRYSEDDVVFALVRAVHAGKRIVGMAHDIFDVCRAAPKIRCRAVGIVKRWRIDVATVAGTDVAQALFEELTEDRTNELETNQADPTIEEIARALEVTRGGCWVEDDEPSERFTIIEVRDPRRRVIFFKAPSSGENPYDFYGPYATFPGEEGVIAYDDDVVVWADSREEMPEDI